jgi:hypothetical protein
MRVFADEQLSAGVITHSQRASAPRSSAAMKTSSGLLPPPPSLHAEPRHTPTTLPRSTRRASRAASNDQARDSLLSLLIEFPVLAHHDHGARFVF